MKGRPRGASMPHGAREGRTMNSSPAQGSPLEGTTDDGTLREHSETAAEGNDGSDMPEIRMHSQEAAEGPDSA